MTSSGDRAQERWGRHFVSAEKELRLSTQAQQVPQNPCFCGKVWQ
jgi:hypothetical protein